MFTVLPYVWSGQIVITHALPDASDGHLKGEAHFLIGLNTKQSKNLLSAGVLCYLDRNDNVLKGNKTNTHFRKAF